MDEITLNSLRKLWPTRNINSHKGDYGRILIIGGNSQYGGAGILASKSAVYAGGGLVTLATTPRNFSAVRSQIAEVMLIDYQDQNALHEQLKKANCVVIGPGLGTSELSLSILLFTLKNINKTASLIIDGSALELIAVHNIELPNHPIILTPHQMEWQKISGLTIDQQTPTNNQKIVDNLHATVVLKHYHTEIYQPLKPVKTIMAGNPGQATGGSGDTLTGIIAALIGQTHNVDQGVILGTFLHSYIADNIYQTQAVVLPHRLIGSLPQTLKQLQNEQ